MHENCTNYKIPKSNLEYWMNKLMRNKERDQEQKKKLEADGWHVITVWGCELKPRKRQDRLEKLFQEVVGNSG